MVRQLFPIISVALGAALVAALPAAAPAQTQTQMQMPKQMRMPAQKQKRKRYPELIYVPTPENVVAKMLEVAKVTKDDYVFDLGSGDGRIPIMAALKHGARGFGVEINPKLVAAARENAKRLGVADRVEFRQQDLFKTSVREATVVALYLFVWANEKLRPRLISELRPGSRIVAHDFPIGDAWKPDIEEDIGDRTVYLWYVPAQVAGAWEVTGGPQPLTLQLRQTFQIIKGTATVAGGRSVPLKAATLRGDAIDLTVELEAGKPVLFRGRVTGDRMEPRDGGHGAATGWSAARAAAAPAKTEPAKSEPAKSEPAASPSQTPAAAPAPEPKPKVLKSRS